jgi:hypothetical protein
VAITGRYLLGLLPMGGVPFTTADDRQDGGRHGVFQPQRLTGPPMDGSSAAGTPRAESQSLARRRATVRE